MFLLYGNRRAKEAPGRGGISFLMAVQGFALPDGVGVLGGLRLTRCLMPEYVRQMGEGPIPFLGIVNPDQTGKKQIHRTGVSAMRHNPIGVRHLRHLGRVRRINLA
jgi:hypothetical protein